MARGTGPCSAGNPPGGSTRLGLNAAITGSTAALKKLLLLAAVCLPLATAPLAAGEKRNNPSLHGVFDEVDSMLEDLREIMGFGPRGPVKLETITKAQFRRLYQKRMKEEQKPREIDSEVAFLKLFGLVPEDFDYEGTVLDLLSEQAWALYDYKRRRLFLADWAPPEAREYALVHELVHAVDDQQFNLDKYVRSARESERQLARLAAVEGQASWVMTEWAMRQSGKSLRGNRLLAIATVSATRFEAEQFPVYESTPLYFREVLIFPYTDGLLFQHDVIERFGTDGLKRVFERPPQTTQQILQPDLYLEGLDPSPPRLAQVAMPKGFRRIYDGTFGQLDHRILLEHHLGDQDRSDLLRKWRGGRFEVYKKRRKGRGILRYAVRWEDREAAREYYHLYRQVCERKWSGLELIDSGDGRCEGASLLGRVLLELDGSTVRSVEGLPESPVTEELEQCCAR